MNNFLKNITNKVLSNDYMTPTGCIPPMKNIPSMEKK